MPGVRFETLAAQTCDPPDNPLSLARRIEACQGYDHKGELFFKIPRNDLTMTAEQMKNSARAPETRKRKRKQVDLQANDDKETWITNIPFSQLSYAQRQKCSEEDLGLPSDRQFWTHLSTRCRVRDDMCGKSLTFTQQAKLLVRFCQHSNNVLFLEAFPDHEKGPMLSQLNIAHESYNQTIQKIYTAKLGTLMRNIKKELITEGLLTITVDSDGNEKLHWAPECEEWEPVHLDEEAPPVVKQSNSEKLFKKILACVTAGKDVLTDAQKAAIVEAIGHLPQQYPERPLQPQKEQHLLRFTGSSPDHQQPAPDVDELGEEITEADREFELRDRDRVAGKKSRRGNR